MNITYRTDKDILYIAIEGRIDASNSTPAEERITAIRSEHAGKHTVFDADRLEYISSAGLRVILKVRKEDADLAIINVSPDVYDVLDMTGFTDILEEFGVWRCVYGHLHGQNAFGRGIKGQVRGVEYQLVSLDYLGAVPKLIYDGAYDSENSDRNGEL